MLNIHPFHQKNKKKSYSQRERYRLKVRAEDKGEPPTYADVEVELDVVDQKNKPPIWDSNVYGPKHIKENVPINTVVATVKARFVIMKEIYSKATQATSATQITVSKFL